MTRVSINPGRVDWCGENPGIYLKENPSDASYSTLALFFRVVLSPYGRGHAAIVLGALMVYEIEPGPKIFETSGPLVRQLLWIACITQSVGFKIRTVIGRIIGATIRGVFTAIVPIREGIEVAGVGHLEGADGTTDGVASAATGKQQGDQSSRTQDGCSLKQENGSPQPDIRL